MISLVFQMPINMMTIMGYFFPSNVWNFEIQNYTLIYGLIMIKALYVCSVITGLFNH